jgi:hypothetical protein
MPVICANRRLHLSNVSDEEVGETDSITKMFARIQAYPEWSRRPNLYVDVDKFKAKVNVTAVAVRIAVAMTRVRRPKCVP